MGRSVEQSRSKAGQVPKQTRLRRRSDIPRRYGDDSEVVVMVVVLLSSVDIIVVTIDVKGYTK